MHATKTKKYAAAFAGLALLAASSGGVWWWWTERQYPPMPVIPAAASVPPTQTEFPLAVTPQNTPSSPPTPAPTDNAPVVAPVPTASGVFTPSQAPAPASEKVPETTPAMPEVPSAGSLSRVTQLQAELNELKLEVQIEELKARMHPPTPPPAPALPDMTALMPPGAPPALPARKTAVISVQGVGEELTATIRTGSTLATVRRGAKFNGGIVADITREGVTVRHGRRITVLPFE